MQNPHLHPQLLPLLQLSLPPLSPLCLLFQWSPRLLGCPILWQRASWTQMKSSLLPAGRGRPGSCMTMKQLTAPSWHFLQMRWGPSLHTERSDCLPFCYMLCKVLVFPAPKPSLYGSTNRIFSLTSTELQWVCTRPCLHQKGLFFLLEYPVVPS